MAIRKSVTPNWPSNGRCVRKWLRETVYGAEEICLTFAKVHFNRSIFGLIYYEWKIRSKVDTSENLYLTALYNRGQKF